MLGTRFDGYDNVSLLRFPARLGPAYCSGAAKIR
jgi:hypothetical protein